ncbi:MAG: hypothetical protein LW855_08700 [Alphaproteobacteria bacterium]|jgi:hypothetical protein|nr:hypothetical protein [Alphaproteobacteria bacterium]
MVLYPFATTLLNAAAKAPMTPQHLFVFDIETIPDTDTDLAPAPHWL